MKETVFPIQNKYSISMLKWVRLAPTIRWLTPDYFKVNLHHFHRMSIISNRICIEWGTLLPNVVSLAQNDLTREPNYFKKKKKEEAGVPSCPCVKSYIWSFEGFTDFNLELFLEDLQRKPTYNNTFIFLLFTSLISWQLRHKSKWFKQELHLTWLYPY